MTQGPIKTYIKRLRSKLIAEDKTRIVRNAGLEGLVKIIYKEDPAESSGVLDWHIVEEPRRLRKVIDLQFYNVLTFFITELLEYEESIQHHANITIVDKRVIIDVNTPSIDDITEIDREYAKFVDNLLIDTKSVNIANDREKNKDNIFF